MRRAIDLLGYRPSHAAQSLRSRSSKTIGCMISDVTNPLYARLFQAIEARLHAEGYMVLLANSLNNAEREVEILSLFQQRGMDGIIITPGNESDKGILALLNSDDMPAVVLDRDMVTNKDSIIFNHVPAVRRTVAHLIDLGHRRIALLVSRVDVRPNRRRIEGFKAAFRSRGLPYPADLICLQTPSASATFEEVVGLLKAHDPPTALVVQGTLTLNSALHGIAAAGARIPRDVSVISIGDPDFAATHVPPIAALRLSPHSIADNIAKLLMCRIRENGTAPPQRITLPFEFDARQSCGPPRGVAASVAMQSSSDS